MSKKFDKLNNIIAIIIFSLLGMAGGIFLSVTLFSGFFNGYEIILALIGILISFYITIIFHEGGHLVFGLISGYGFSSFRIGNFMWIMQDGEIKIRRLSIAGTGGQCLMTPPVTQNGKYPVILYNLGGVFANLLLCLIFISLYFFTVHKVILLALVLLYGAIISFIVGLTNGIPLNIGGIANDGMNALHLSKDSVAASAFVNQLNMNAAQARGVRISDMPDEWFLLPEGADMQNVLCASVKVFAVSRTLDRLDTVAAENEINALLHSNYNIIGLHRNLLKCDLVFARLINQGKEAEISSLLGAEQLKFMKSMSSYPSVLRTEYAISLIRDQDEKKAEQIKACFEKNAKKFPYPSEIEMECELMNLALERHKNNI